MASKDHWYLEGGSKPSLRAWIFNEMARGAVYAGLVVFGCILFVLVIYGLSGLLPDDPYAALDTTAALTATV